MTFALLRFPVVLVIIKHMGKAISVLKQIKIKSNRYADLVVLENGWYKVRKYKVTTYKKYKVNSGVNFGQVHRYSGNPRIGGGAELICCQDINLAQKTFENLLNNMKEKGQSFSVCRVLKLFNWE